MYICSTYFVRQVIVGLEYIIYLLALIFVYFTDQLTNLPH